MFLHNHMLSNPILENAAQAERERHDLKSALIAAQESAIIQILLECCLPREDEQREVNNHKSTYLSNDKRICGDVLGYTVPKLW